MNTTNINVMMLKTLDSLRETGSISRTAEQLHVTQSAVSHAVKALEKTLETPVVIRHPRGISLTAAGLTASESATVALEAIDNILKLASSSLSGTVSIAAINCVSRVILTEVLSTVRKTHPNVEINLFTGTDQEVEHWVKSGIADIGIAYNMAPSCSELLFDDEFYFITPFGQAKTSNIDLNSLDSKPIIISSSGCEIFIQDLFDHHQHELAIKTTVSDTAALFSIVSSGYGTSLVPGLAFPSGWKTLVTRQAVLPTLTCSLRLMCAQGKAENDAVQALMEEIRKVALSKKSLI
ncbi:LysR family transcriptional regulator [Vibrio bivalvicida]|uniref:LysR family transcriptional regulator n=1 Tax=Vibrio bivalvicida TaxID=1276888 RepID=A0ABV4MC78_9VIBR